MNEIENDNEKKAILLASLSRSAIKKLIKLLDDDAFDTYTYNHIAYKFDALYTRELSWVVEKNAFYAARKYPNESLYQWSARLKWLAKPCNFGADYDHILRDKFILGLEDGYVRRLLFNQNVDVSFIETYDKAVRTEFLIKYHNMNVESAWKLIHYRPPPRPTAPKPNLHEENKPEPLYEEIDNYVAQPKETIQNIEAATTEINNNETKMKSSKITKDADPIYFVTNHVNDDKIKKLSSNKSKKNSTKKNDIKSKNNETVSSIKSEVQCLSVESKGDNDVFSYETNERKKFSIILLRPKFIKTKKS